MSNQTFTTETTEWHKLPRPLFSGTADCDGLRVPRTATTYACRMEFDDQIFEFLGILPYQHVFGFQMARMLLVEDDPHPVTDKYLEIIICTLELWEVRGLLVSGQDLHVMAETIQPVEKYTGERCDYEDVWADHKRLWDERPNWLELHILYHEDADGPSKVGPILGRHGEFGPRGVDAEVLRSQGLSEAWAMA